MPSPSTFRPLVVLGPTAGGKSELAVALARRFAPAEVLGADSMQVYRRLEAGTAKPTAAQRASVPHHLIDLAEPTERFTVADWLALAEPLLADLRGRGVRPIVVGGTNLYLKALLEGMFEGPEGDPALRARLAAETGTALHERLRRVDPAAADRIHPNDRKKLVRALEVFELTGRPISAWQREWSGSGGSGPGPRATGNSDSLSNPDPRPEAPDLRPYRHDPILLGLDWPVEAINRRINARVKRMFFPVVEEGPPPESLPAEVRRLEAAGALGPQAREALGYKQVLAHLAGGGTLDEAMEATKVQTRQFAKRQRTWLKRFRGVHWLPAADRPFEAVINEAVAVVEASAPSRRGPGFSPSPGVREGSSERTQEIDAECGDPRDLD